MNDKLEGSVATYLRCGGVVNNQIKRGLLLNLKSESVKNYRQNYCHESVALFFGPPCTAGADEVQLANWSQVQFVSMETLVG